MIAHEPTMPLLRPIPIPTQTESSFRNLLNWLTYIRKWEVAENYCMYIDSLKCYAMIPGTYIEGPVKVSGFVSDFSRLTVTSVGFTNLVATPCTCVEKILKKQGFVFDGASIPKIFTNLLSPTGILFIPGLFHDFGYKYQCLLDCKGNRIFNGESQAFFDRMFDDISIQVNGMIVPSLTAYAALRGLGFISWNNHRKTNSQVEIDFPHLKLLQD